MHRPNWYRLRPVRIPGGGGMHGDPRRATAANGILHQSIHESGVPMRTTRVAAVSMNGFLGEPERVLHAIDGWCQEAAAQGAELVLFPELVIHGHCTPNTWELAEPVPDGPSVRRLAEIARRYSLVVCAGLSEKERDIVFNTQVLVGPHGYIGKQR